MSSEQRFGYEWQRYDKLEPSYELQFKNWVYPLGTEDFEGKVVLDAGCGIGRNSYWSLKWGAEKVTAFDHDHRTVAVARNNLKEFQNAEVLFQDIYTTPWREEFDIAFSIGVIHHLENPTTALANIVRALKPNGTLVIWVYSYEGNEWILRYVNPIRSHVTSKLPVGVVYWLSYLCSVPLWLIIKIFQGPTLYLRQLSKFKFWHVHSIVFDQLIPKVAHYWKKEEVAAMMEQLPVNNIQIRHPPNGSGWTAMAIKN